MRERYLRLAFQQLVRRGLRGVWLRGSLPDGPFVFAANHHTWWDPFLAAVVLWNHGREASLLMRSDNVQRYRFVRSLGVFGADEPRRGLRYLAGGRALVIYPEGELRAPGPLGQLAGGAGWYARQAGVPLCAVATRVLVRGHQAPEAYLTASPVDTTGTLVEATGRLGSELRRQLSDVDCLVTMADPREPLPGFRLIAYGRRSWDERIDAIRRWRP